MEAPADATAFVNFANRNFGYGRFIASCTQEEILQVCCPEFNVGMLFVGEMRDGEVVNVRGARRFARYAGYLDTFRCVGGLDAPPRAPCDVVVLDACLARHFGDMQLRDLGKAIAAFGALRAARGGGGGGGGGDDDDGDVVVSTGRWGCGVFGGVPAHKFLQQLVAARVAGVRLAFSTFGTPDGVDRVLDALRARPRMSVAKAWAVLARAERGSSRAVADALVAAILAEPPGGEPADALPPPPPAKAADECCA